jgi:hypothetical protein
VRWTLPASRTLRERWRVPRARGTKCALGQFPTRRHDITGIAPTRLALQGSASTDSDVHPHGKHRGLLPGARPPRLPVRGRRSARSWTLVISHCRLDLGRAGRGRLRCRRVVAVVASLRRPKVELIALETAPKLGIAETGVIVLSDEGNSVRLPTSKLRVLFYVVNTGVTPTLVKGEFRADNFRTKLRATQVWSGIEGVLTPSFPLPLVLEGNSATDVCSFGFVDLVPDWDRLVDPKWTGSPDTGEFARRLHHMQSFSFDVRYVYSSFKFPFLWRRDWRDGKSRLEIVVSKRHKDALIVAWSRNPALERLTAILEDGTPRPRPSGGLFPTPAEARARYEAALAATDDGAERREDDRADRGEDS